MKRFAWQWLAISSLLLATLGTNAATRPQYGGTLRVTMSAALSTLDPADSSAADSFGRRNVTRLIFDTLIVMDAAGRPQPALAESWQALPGEHRWQFRIRHNVIFQDGTPLTAETAAASLRYANPSWEVTVKGEMLTADSDASVPNLLPELALPRNAIVKRDSDHRLSGTGPFHIVDWRPGSKLSLAAEENCWSGRPFLDEIEIEMGNSFRDQMSALQLGKADLVEVAPEPAHRVSRDERRLEGSPMEVLALLFARAASSPEEKLLREALASSVDRDSIHKVLLQGAGEAAASILPTWISGFGFVFPTGADLPKARQLRDQAHSVTNWKLEYDGNDPLDRLLAERIALNAKDAGLSLQPTSGTGADLRLVRIPLASSDPWTALDAAIAQFGLPPVNRNGASLEDLYAAEQELLAQDRIIPLFQLPVTYASAPNLHSWSLRMDGSWNLSAAWLENPRP